MQIPPFHPSALAGIAALLVSALAARGLLLLRAPAPATHQMQTLDGLRGLLALGVFVSHFIGIFYYFQTGRWGGLPIRFYDRIGFIGVALFFMVTAFLFWSRMLEMEGRLHWVSLYISRIFRVVPLYWFMVAALVVIVYLASDRQVLVPLKALAGQVLVWLSFTDYPNINKYAGTLGIVAGVVWTLKYEWLFYLTLPLQALFIRASKKTPLPLWLLAAGVLWVSLQPVYFEALKMTGGFFIYFLGGGLAAVAYRSQRLRELARHPLATLGASISLFLVFLLFDSEFGWGQAVLLALFFTPVALGNSFLGLLTRRSLCLLGEISYSVYLLHGMLLFTLYWMVFPTLMQSVTQPYQLYLALFLTSALLVVVSWLTYTLVEKPFIRLGKWLAARLKREAAHA